MVAYGDDGAGGEKRKADVLKLEQGKSAKPNAATQKKFRDALGITTDEVAEIAQKLSSKEQLENLDSLSRDQLIELAKLFEAEQPEVMSDQALFTFLIQKAEENRDRKTITDELDEQMSAIANLKIAAQDAATKLNFDEVEDLLSRVDVVET